MNKEFKATVMAPEAKKDNPAKKAQNTVVSHSKNSPFNYIMSLHRTVGNQAVQRLFESSAIQAKLQISQPGDIYEQEADRVAEQVMRMPESPKQTCLYGKGLLKSQEEQSENRRLQAKSVHTNDIVENIVPPVVHEVLRTPGKPVDQPLLTIMESRLRHNFSNVRVHADQLSARAAETMGARAYTVGSHLVFGRGWYAPTSREGKRLLAHELAHVVQQNGSTPRMQLKPNLQDDRNAVIVQRMIDSAIRELDRGDPSHIVLLQTGLIAGKHGGFKQFGLALAERLHPEFGTYLNAFLVYLHARGSESLAGIVVEKFREAGLVLLKSAEQPQDDKSLPGATGTGLGSILVYEGKTLVKIGNTLFYISGKPLDYYWKGKTTSVLFIVNKNDPKKMYRLDYDILKQGPRFGVRGWEHNQKGVAKVLGLKITNHQPAGVGGRAAGRAIQVFKWGGRVLFMVGVGSEGVEIYYALDRKRAVFGAVASLGGSTAGSLRGAARGARLGRNFGPWGAAGGALVGGAVGGWLGSKLAKAGTQMAYDYFVTPIQKEEWVVFEETEVEPTGQEKAP